MRLTAANNTSDQQRWMCRRSRGGRKHVLTLSIRHGSWMAKSKLTLEEIMKITYYWTTGLTQVIGKKIYIHVVREFVASLFFF